MVHNKHNNIYKFPKNSDYKEHERFLYASKGVIDVVHTTNQYFPWMIFSGSSTGHEADSSPTTVFMQYTIDGTLFMIIDLEYEYED